jgi:hypothetical protein
MCGRTLPLRSLLPGGGESGRGRGVARGRGAHAVAPGRGVYVAPRGGRGAHGGAAAGRGFGRGRGGWAPPAPPAAPSRTRCKYWPDCRMPAGTCEFVHPTVDCTAFPNCPYGAECLFVHPAIKTAIALTGAPPPASRGGARGRGRGAGAGRGGGGVLGGAEGVVCKYGDKCDRITCTFRHPWRSDGGAAAAAAVDTSALSSSLPKTPPHVPVAATEAPAAAAAAAAPAAATAVATQ